MSAAANTVPASSGATLAGDVALGGAPFARGATLRGGVADAVQRKAVAGVYRYVTGAGQELTTIGPEAEEAAAQAAAETAAAGAAASTVPGAKAAADFAFLVAADVWCFTQ